MIKADIHTHTTFSEDGIDDIIDMIEKACELNFTYYGISEHFNYDYDRIHLKIDGNFVRPIDEFAYFSRIRTLQNEYKSRVTLLAGGEFGYDHDSQVLQRYIRTQEQSRPDFIINSVHTCQREECFFDEYFRGKSMAFAYNAYLYRVLESLDAPYDYDIVAHVGYCARNAKYPDPKIRYNDYCDVLDEILKRIIQKDKILEVNSSSRTCGSEFLPDTDILYRYFELGGRAVSFASDAHNTVRIGEKYDLVCAALKKIGFTHLTVPNKHQRIQIPFD